MDHDRLFKELLTTFFVEFLELFFPEVAAGIDRQSVQFLDKELITDIALTDRNEVDLVARVRLSGNEAFILIHVENQSTWQTNFAQRMFGYYAKLYSKHDLPIYPIALLSYDRPQSPIEDKVEVTLFDLPVLRYQFRAIQLNRLSWRDFISRPNPVASSLMSKMKIAADDRPRVKLECLRMLATLKLDPARAELIAVFMNSYLKLTAAEQSVYDREYEEFGTPEKENIMRLMSEWGEKAYLDGQINMVHRQLRHRFGQLPTELSGQIATLTIEQLDNLAEALLDFKTIDDARVWLSQIAAA